MANFSIKPNDMAGFNPVKEYLKTFKNNLDNTNGNLNAMSGSGLSDVLNSNPHLAQDKELNRDLDVLLKGEVSLNQSLDGRNIEGAGAGPLGVSGVQGLNADNTVKTFSNVLGNYMGDVNSLQKQSEKAVEVFSSGGNIDLHSVMIASEKAGLAMQLTMQMRNKVLQAYQEISRMPV